MLTQIAQPFSTTHLLPLSIFVLLLYLLDAYRPALVVVAAKHHRPLVTSWSHYSECGQMEVCDTCGQCHYCSDVALPCSGVLRSRISHLLAATINSRQDVPFKDQYSITSSCNAIQTTGQKLAPQSQPHPFALAGGSDWLIIRPRQSHSDDDDDGDSPRPASLPSFPAPLAGGAAVAVIMVVVSQQEEDTDLE